MSEILILLDDDDDMYFIRGYRSWSRMSRLVV